MVRYEIENPPIIVAYGFDEVTGVFLSVTDKRLSYDSSASEEVNKVTESIGIGDGGGSYFNLHTGVIGLGTQVSHTAMREFLKRYGVPKERIDEVFLHDTPMIDVCCLCKQKPKICTKCESPYAPCLTSESTDFTIHKFSFCKCDTLSSKNSTIKRVYGFFFPENNQKPVLIQIEIKNKKIKNSFYECPCLELFLGDCDLDKRMITRNPVKPEKKFPNTLKVFFRDRFLKDGSKSNMLVRKITEGKNHYDWRGPIVIMKCVGTDLNTDSVYMDVGLEDFSDIIDYFVWYGFAS